MALLIRTIVLFMFTINIIGHQMEDLPDNFHFWWIVWKKFNQALGALTHTLRSLREVIQNYRLILRETTLSQRFTLITQLILRITEIKLVNSKILSRGHQDLMYMKILEYKLTNLTEISGLLIGIGKWENVDMISQNQISVESQQISWILTTF